MDPATDQLIGAYLSGTTTEAETEELSRLIEGDAGVRDRYLALAEVHALLATDEALWEPAALGSRAGSAGAVRVSMFGGWRTGAGLAAVAVAVIGALWTLWPTSKDGGEAHGPVVFAPDGPISAPPASGSPVAFLQQSAGVVWADAAAAPAVGAALPAGTLDFSAGWVRLEFLTGAELVVQGPAQVELETENSAWLHHGTARAYVPEPARGFVLKTPGATVQDLGTSFGLAAAEGSPPEVHVFEGVVEVHPHGGDGIRVGASHAVRVEGPRVSAVPLRIDDFPSAAAFDEAAARSGAGEFDQWRRSVDRLGRDPAVAALFAFWNEDDLPFAAAVVRAEWAAGRWPEKSALGFHGPRDRLRFRVEEGLPSLTLLARVRVEALANDYNALVLPSHYTAGSLHWILERGGELRLTMLADPARPLHSGGWDGPVSAPALTPMDLGRWITLATTYDSVTGRVIHYCDGREAGRGMFARRLPAQLGDVEFGNWGADGVDADNEWIRHQPPNQKKRHFTGRLDFLTVVRRVLTAEELLPLMQP